MELFSIYVTYIENSTSTKGTYGAKGSGPGMAITTEFIEQHHGEFVIEGFPGKGSTFAFTIPIKPAKEASLKY
ncbi:ATP-binding protein [Marinilabilia rubra]|uniref:Histidine kinase/HSP90-like ATPase domain-containing protein n=1 Tax=Marinilabilia rubra TaxID=2162893 RepID=A0A2U2BAH8_9BACT|nr:ATP-binding protein [Marinilabilia rubra]PWE00070.1 hypothetical protein DDZ16_06840 [Marinilabilia rubra]